MLETALRMLLAIDPSTIDRTTSTGELMHLRVCTALELTRKLAGHQRLQALRDAERDRDMTTAYDRILKESAAELEVFADRLLQIVSSHSLPIAANVQ